MPALQALRDPLEIADAHTWPPSSGVRIAVPQPGALYDRPVDQAPDGWGDVDHADAGHERPRSHPHEQPFEELVCETAREDSDLFEVEAPARTLPLATARTRSRCPISPSDHSTALSVSRVVFSPPRTSSITRSRMASWPSSPSSRNLTADTWPPRCLFRSNPSGSMWKAQFALTKKGVPGPDRSGRPVQTGHLASPCSV